MLKRSTSRLLVLSACGVSRSCGPLRATRLQRESKKAGGSFMDMLRQQYMNMQVERDRKLDLAEAAEWQRMREGSGSSQSSDAMPSTVSRRIAEDATACPRSVLFVPGSKPRAMQKIPQLPADCFILDLEDSVAPSSKREARANVRTFVLSVSKELPEGRRPRLVVRINSPDFDSSNAMLDLELVGELGSNVEGVAIPKVTRSTYGLVKDYVHPDHALWAFFESPSSVLQGAEICAQRVYKYAVLGYNDLATELQLPLSATSGDIAAPAAVSSPGDGAAASDGKGPVGLYDDVTQIDVAALHLTSRLPLMYCSAHVITCARANDMYVLDGVYNNTTDPVGFCRDLRQCLAFGFNGKTLIHPSQIDATNRAFVPTAAEVEWASRVREAVASSGGGVTVVGGKMVEDLHKRQANRIAALHQSAQLDSAESARQAEEGAPRRPAPPSRRAPPPPPV